MTDIACVSRYVFFCFLYFTKWLSICSRAMITIGVTNWGRDTTDALCASLLLYQMVYVYGDLDAISTGLALDLQWPSWPQARCGCHQWKSVCAFDCLEEYPNIQHHLQRRTYPLSQFDVHTIKCLLSSVQTHGMPWPLADLGLPCRKDLKLNVKIFSLLTGSSIKFVATTPTMS